MGINCEFILKNYFMYSYMRILLGFLQHLQFLSLSYLWKVQFVSTDVVNVTRRAAQVEPNRSIVSLLAHKTSRRLQDEPEQSGDHRDDPVHGRPQHSEAVKEAALHKSSESVHSHKETFTAIPEGRGPTERSKVRGTSNRCKTATGSKNRKQI